MEVRTLTSDEKKMLRELGRGLLTLRGWSLHYLGRIEEKRRRHELRPPTSGGGPLGVSIQGGERLPLGQAFLERSEAAFPWEPRAEAYREAVNDLVDLLPEPHRGILSGAVVCSREQYEEALVPLALYALGLDRLTEETDEGEAA